VSVPDSPIENSSAANIAALPARLRISDSWLGREEERFFPAGIRSVETSDGMVMGGGV